MAGEVKSMTASSTAEVIRGVHELAAQRGWKPVEELASTLLSSPAPPEILLARGKGAESRALRAWIRGAMPDANILETEMRQIAETPSLALLAPKLVAVFASGCLLEAEDVRVIEEQYLPRPLGSFAIIFTGAERLESREDLKLMERAIWRVLVPSPKMDWQGQDLATYQCYFWSSAGTREFLRERCERDAGKLLGVLRAPITEEDADSLERGRAMWLLQLADGYAPGEAKEKNDEAALEELQKQLRELRRRLVRRLNADSASLGRQITASLVKIENDLARRLDETCQTHMRKWNAATTSTTAFQRLLERRLEESLRESQKRLQAELDQYVAQTAARTQALLQEVDWPLADRLIGGVKQPAVSTWMLQGVSRAARAPRIEAAAGIETAQAALAIREAMAASSLAGLASLTVGIVTASIVSGVLVAAVFMRERNRSFKSSRKAMQRAVHEMTEKAIPKVRTEVRTAIAEYRDQALSRIQEVEAAIEARRRGRGLAGAAAGPARHSDREQLLEFRRKLW
jgi:hypothetical protein